MSADARDALRASHMRLQQRCHDAEAHVARLLKANREQADRIAWLEGEVAGWRIKLAETIEDAERYRDALEKVAETDGGEWFARSVARAALDGTPSEDA